MTLLTIDIRLFLELDIEYGITYIILPNIWIYMLLFDIFENLLFICFYRY